MSSIPPLPALKAFLAACRTGSYTAAAKELYVTHGAISRQIQTLEQWLGQKLFEKSGQKMAPTLHALEFAREMSEALERIDDAALRYGKGSATAQLRVSTPTTFAMRWLIPRLPAFHAKYPGSVVQVLTAHTQQMSLAGSFDLAIRRGPPPSAHFSAQPFYEEWHTLVMAPSLIQRQPLSTLSDLPKHLLLETETRPGHWQQWLNMACYIDGERLRRQRFDHFYVTWSAVIDGLGIGIGPMPTLLTDIQAGRLCMPFPDIRTDSRRYFALTPSGTQKTLLHHRFTDWLVEQGTPDV